MLSFLTKFKGIKSCINMEGKGINSPNKISFIILKIYDKNDHIRSYISNCLFFSQSNIISPGKKIDLESFVHHTFKGDNRK